MKQIVSYANKELSLPIQRILLFYNRKKMLKIDFLISDKFDKDKQLKHQNIGKVYVKMDMVDDNIFYKNMK